MLAVEKQGNAALPFIPRSAPTSRPTACISASSSSPARRRGRSRVYTATPPAARVWLAPLPDSKFALVSGP